jgi:glutaredoxin
MGICCSSSEKNKILDGIKSDINNQFIIVYSKVGCPKCLKIKTLLHSIRAEFKIIETNSLNMKYVLKELTKQKSLPYVFINGEFIQTRKLETEVKKGNIGNMIKTRKSDASVPTIDPQE